MCVLLCVLLCGLIKLKNVIASSLEGVKDKLHALPVWSFSYGVIDDRNYWRENKEPSADSGIYPGRIGRTFIHEKIHHIRIRE